MTHKTIHTSEHNDWLWKTVRYMVQPYKIKSYSRAQLHNTTAPHTVTILIQYASAVCKEYAPSVYMFVFKYVWILLLSSFSFNSALTDNFPLCCSKSICSGCLTNIAIRRRDPYFIHSSHYFPKFRWVLLVCSSLPTSPSSAGMVEKWTNKGMNEWTNERTDEC